MLALGCWMNLTENLGGEIDTFSKRLELLESKASYSAASDEFRRDVERLYGRDYKLECAYHWEGVVRKVSSASGCVSCRCWESEAPHADQGQLEIPLEQQQVFAVTSVAAEARGIGAMDEGNVHHRWCDMTVKKTRVTLVFTR